MFNKAAFTLLLCLCCLSISAQTSKKDNAGISKSAQKWFKDIFLKTEYGEFSNYKINEFKATPVTKLQHIQLEIDKAKQGISENDTVAPGSNYSHYLFLIAKDQAAYEQLLNEGKGDTAEAINKKKQINDYQEKINHTKIRFIEAMSAKEYWNNALNDLEQTQANQTEHYNVYINCQWKDTTGKLLKGNFYFNYNQQGLSGKIVAHTF
jgi:plasmid maintenance system killer protein